MLKADETVDARSGNGSVETRSAAPQIDGSEMLILWAMRQWMQAHFERRCATAMILDAFEFSGMVAAMAPLNRVMTLLTVGPRRRLGIARSDSAPVSVDETVLLRILTAARSQQRDLVESRLCMWMDLGHAVATGQAILQLADTIYRPVPTAPRCFRTS